MPDTWIAEMASLAAVTTGVDADHAIAVGRTLSAERLGDREPGSRVSGLNHDGTPLQLCVTVAPQGAGSRLLADPAAGEPDLHRRFERAYGALDAALTLGDAGLRPYAERLLATLVPDRRAVAECPDGVLWIGAGLSRPGAAVYVDARRRDGAALFTWLAGELGDAPGGHALRRAAGAPVAAIQSAGVESAAAGGARLKFYWRLRRPTRLADAGLDALADPRFAEFTQIALAPRGELRLSGIVLSASVSFLTGALSDVKLDLCGCPHCLALTAGQWGEVLGEIAARNDLALPPLEELLARAEVAFVGFGLNAAGEPRLNIYAKQPTAAPRETLDRDRFAAVGLSGAAGTRALAEGLA